ncbi:hypothetical protein VV02_16715 [Luteipulveratus mongoliensis]|uniref:Phosphodiesterase n=1 Tax=Luteipulveratus mongoliensis TaxID=571913 RepID=A0A0K1JQL6_9MICO|nr:hypothetical protein VV02_16715 [Luteipulveratus mongoliensis]
MGRNRLLLIGLDGVRLDTLREARTPNIDTISAAGFFAPVEVSRQAPSASGASWSTIATGVWPAKHGVIENDFVDHRLADFPDFLSRLRHEVPGLKTYVGVAWPPLVDDVPGPVYQGGGVLADTGNGGVADDDRTAVSAAKALSDGSVHVSFLHFDLCDHIGHEQGPGPAYTAAVEDSDHRIGLVLKGIQARPSYAEEDWTYVVTTDHGHRDGGGHGGDSDAERTAWIAASGPGVPSTPPRSLEQVDIHAHALSVFGVDPAPDWQLDGRPFGRDD